MNLPFQSIASSFDVVAALYPPQGVLHIGAHGHDVVSPYTKLNVSKLCLVEARKDKADELSASLELRDDIQVLHAVIAEAAGQAIFHQASLAKESGLISPNALSQFWQNLTSMHEETVETTTIETLLSRLEEGPDEVPFNWLIVDCLPGLPILKGAGDRLKNFDIIIVRTIGGEQSSLGLAGCAQSAVSAFLADNGFRVVGEVCELQKEIVHVTFVQDWKCTHIRSLIGYESALADKDKKRDAAVQGLETKQTRLEGALKQVIEENKIFRSALERMGVPKDTLQNFKMRNGNGLEEILAAYETEINELDALLKAVKQENRALQTEVEQGAEFKRAMVQAEKKQRLAENNLRNLQARYHALAEDNLEQAKTLERIASKLHWLKRYVEDDTDGNS